MKRKTITYNEDIFNTLKGLNNNDRLIVYDTLNNHFLNGKPIEYSDYSYTVANILASIAPQIRKLESKYSNGKSEKKESANTKASYCPQNGSELKLTEADANIKISPYNKYNTMNKYNHLYKQTTARAHTCEETNKNNNDGHEVVVALEQIAKLDPAIASRTLILVEELQKESEEIKLGRKVLAPGEILAALEQYIQKPTIVEELRYYYNQIDKTPGIRNPYKYTLSLLYTVATNQKQTSKKESADMIQQRNYSKNELDSLFSNLEVDEF